MGSCQHCGRAHPAEDTLCYVTLEPLSSPGLCGTRLDRYLVERLLGTGGFGAVYQAKHARTEAPVALKVLSQKLSTNDTMLERFMREARTAAAVGDEHIVRVLDAEVTPDGTAFIAMELLEGLDLKQLASREKPLHPARVVGLVAQVLDGLSAAHAKDVVHRDLKPANVFVIRRLDADGQEVEFAKLLDFGISKMLTGPETNPLTIAGTTLGTPGYMAFEQFFDARSVDARADIYAVAVILFELLSGKKPFDADSYAAMVNAVRIGAQPPLRSVAPALPVPLCAVVDKGLSKHKERRWQTAKEFAAALRGTLGLLGEPPPLAPREAPPVVPAEDGEKVIDTVLKTNPSEPGRETILTDAGKRR